MTYTLDDLDRIQNYDPFSGRVITAYKLTFPKSLNFGDPVFFDPNFNQSNLREYKPLHKNDDIDMSSERHSVVTEEELLSLLEGGEK